MDIVLDTIFNNPRLPIAPRPGFRDTFPEAGGTLVMTEDGKPWYSNNEPWPITAEGFATSPGRSSRVHVDGLASDGLLTTVIGRQASESADKRGGLMLRRASDSDYIYISPSTQNALHLYARADNTTVINTQLSSHSLATGDELAAHMQGTQITVLLNGEEIHQQQVAYHASATNHGFYMNTGCDTAFASIEFTA